MALTEHIKEERYSKEGVLVSRTYYSEEEWAALETQATQDAQAAVAETVKNRILDAMTFGKNLMAEYGASNVLAGKTTAEIRAISDKLSAVQTLLLSGSLYACLDAMEQVEPDALVTAEKILEFKNKIRAYLGMALL